jgi:hypothetical protein
MSSIPLLNRSKVQDILLLNCIFGHHTTQGWSAFGPHRHRRAVCCGQGLLLNGAGPFPPELSVWAGIVVGAIPGRIPDLGGTSAAQFPE